MKFEIRRASDAFPCEEAQPSIKTLVSGYQYTIYHIDINSLDELIKFINKYGSIVIYTTDDENPEYSIIIYDDYIE